MQEQNKKKEFHEILTELIEFATVSGNRISMDTVQLYFKNLNLNETQLSYIYKYLTDTKIMVEGFSFSEQAPPASDSKAASPIQNSSLDKPENSPAKKVISESNEALAFYEMYLDELDFEKEQLSKNSHLSADFLKSGNPEHASILTTHYLPLVLELAKEFDDQGLSHSDLVAEGNLALFEGICEYVTLPEKELSISGLETFLNKKIRQALHAALNEEIGSNRVSSHLADQINRLNDASTELAKDFGREATLKELCDYLSLSEDEVKELMKVSIDALTVVDTGDFSQSKN